MNRTILIGLVIIEAVIVLALIQPSLASEYGYVTYNTTETFNIIVACEDAFGLPCNSSIACNLTHSSPSGNLGIMQMGYYSLGFFNKTLSSVPFIGVNSAIANCTDGTNKGTIDASFEIKKIITPTSVPSDIGVISNPYNYSYTINETASLAVVFNYQNYIETAPLSKVEVPVTVKNNNPFIVKIKLSLPNGTSPSGVTYPINEITIQPSGTESFTLTLPSDKNGRFQYNFPLQENITGSIYNGTLGITVWVDQYYIVTVIARYILAYSWVIIGASILLIIIVIIISRRRKR